MSKGEGRLGRRFKRILVLIPYALRNPGVSLEELCERFGASKQELLRDLDLIYMCGLPGYGPGDLIDVSINNERVWVSMADYFYQPLRITPAEALALYAGGAAIAALPGMEQADALRRALGKVRAALHSGDRGAEVAVRVEAGSPEHVQTLEDALGKRRRVRVEYLSASRGELTERVVHPWGLVTTLGHWYLIGWDELSGEERMFRTDRIKSVVMLDDEARPAPPIDPARYKGAFVARGRERLVTFEISPAAARWFEDYYPVRSARDLSDGWRRVQLVTGGTRWAATLVLRLGNDVRRVEPAEVRDEARRLADAISARYAPR